MITHGSRQAPPRVLHSAGQLTPVLRLIATEWRDFADSAVHASSAASPLPPFVSGMAELVLAKAAFHTEHAAYSGFYAAPEDAAAVAQLRQLLSPTPASTELTDDQRRSTLSIVSLLLSIAVSSQKLLSTALQVAAAHMPTPE